MMTTEKHNDRPTTLTVVYDLARAMERIKEVKLRSSSD